VQKNSQVTSAALFLELETDILTFRTPLETGHAVAKIVSSVEAARFRQASPSALSGPALAKMRFLPCSLWRSLRVQAAFYVTIDGFEQRNSTLRQRASAASRTSHRFWPSRQRSSRCYRSQRRSTDGNPLVDSPQSR
jgi:hypothetical protein